MFARAIFIHIGNRARKHHPDQPEPGIGVLKNISISNIIADVVDGDYCCSITGEPGHPVETITLDNIQIRHPGGGARELAALVVPEKPKDYPELILCMGRCLLLDFIAAMRKGSRCGI